MSSSSPVRRRPARSQPGQVVEDQRGREVDAVVAGLQPLGEQSGPQRAEVDALGRGAERAQGDAGAAAEEQQLDQPGRAGLIRARRASRLRRAGGGPSRASRAQCELAVDLPVVPRVPGPPASTAGVKRAVLRTARAWKTRS